jgi:hypothetical protein
VPRGSTINRRLFPSAHPLPWNPQHTNPPGGLVKYYRDHVVGGPGAFVMMAEDFNSFGRAITNKLVAEIAHKGAPARAAFAIPASATGEAAAPH